MCFKLIQHFSVYKASEVIYVVFNITILMWRNHCHFTDEKIFTINKTTWSKSEPLSYPIQIMFPRWNRCTFHFSSNSSLINMHNLSFKTCDWKIEQHCLSLTKWPHSAKQHSLCLLTWDHGKKSNWALFRCFIFHSSTKSFHCSWSLFQKQLYFKSSNFQRYALFKKW